MAGRKAKPSTAVDDDGPDQDYPATPGRIEPPDNTDGVAELLVSEQPGYGEYEIDIEDTLRKALPGAFDTIRAASLTEASVATIPPGAKGAYLLFLDDLMVYAGKTDTRHGFAERLGRHVRSVKHRVGLDPRKMTFKALRIWVFSAFDVEAILIAEMRRLHKGVLAWNDSGFGSNDPGRKRDDGEPSEFERTFPIDIDMPLMSISEHTATVSQLLKEAKQAAPYLLRYGHVTGFGDTPVGVPVNPSMRDILEAVADVLPAAFQITVFHGRVILYREDKEYEFTLEVIRGRE